MAEGCCFTSNDSGRRDESASIATVDDAENDDVADQRTEPRDDKTSDEIAVGHHARIDEVHPEGTETEDPDHRIERTENGIAEGLYRLCKDRYRRADELELQHDANAGQCVGREIGRAHV